GAYVLLASPSGALPKFLLQRVGEAKRTKNRMHLDIETPDVERLEGIGARRVDRHARTGHGSRWVVMAGPEGNECWVCDGGAGGGKQQHHEDHKLLHPPIPHHHALRTGPRQLPCGGPSPRVVSRGLGPGTCSPTLPA